MYRFLLLVLPLLLSVESSLAADRVRIDRIATQGEPAPGLGEGVVFGVPREEGVDDHGGVVFSTNLKGPGISPTDDASYWRADAMGELTLVLREGDPVPSAPSLQARFTRTLLDLGGTIAAWSGGIAGATTCDDELIVGPIAGGLGVLAREGDPAPGTSGTFGASGSCNSTTFGTSIALNAADQVLFEGHVLSQPAFWRSDGAGGLERVIGFGDQAPGTEPGVVFGYNQDISCGSPSNFSRPQIDASGAPAFHARVWGPGVVPETCQGIWGPDGAGGITLVARSGHPAGPLGSDVVFPWLSTETFALSSTGITYFTTRLEGGDPAQRSALFRFDPASGLSVIAREGTPAPDGQLFGPLWTEIDAGATGPVFREAAISGSGRSALYGPDGLGGIRTIAREGDPLPDRPGVHFVGFPHTPLVTDAGDVLLLADTDVVKHVSRGVPQWARALILARPDGTLRTVAMETEPLEVAPGDERSIYLLSVGERRPAPAQVLNSQGVISFAGTVFDPTDLEADIITALYSAHAIGCSDGIDNDGDTLVDWPDDPGCTDAQDMTERGAEYACDNGLDDDGDGYTDFTVDPADGGDPACPNAFASSEVTQCQDGLDNDGDGTIDADGGASLNGGVPIAESDPQCGGAFWRNREHPKSGFCGLGWELAPLMAGLLGLRRRRSHS